MHPRPEPARGLFPTDLATGVAQLALAWPHLRVALRENHMADARPRCPALQYVFTR